jgi:hypothetical protein
MTPAEHVEQLCKQANERLEKQIPTATRVPMEVSSRILYSREVGPIEAGYHDEYMDGDFDEIIETYLTEISNKFHNRMVDLGLRPKESFDEYMGPKYKNEPKPTYEQLLERIDSTTNQFEHVNKRFQSDLASVPESIRDNELTRLQNVIGSLWDSVKKKEYQTTKDDKQYAKEYFRKHNEYWDMWKD